MVSRCNPKSSPATFKHHCHQKRCRRSTQVRHCTAPSIRIHWACLQLPGLLSVCAPDCEELPIKLFRFATWFKPVYCTLPVAWHNQKSPFLLTAPGLVRCLHDTNEPKVIRLVQYRFRNNVKAFPTSDEDEICYPTIFRCSGCNYSYVDDLKNIRWWNRVLEFKLLKVNQIKAAKNLLFCMTCKNQGK